MKLIQYRYIDHTFCDKKLFRFNSNSIFWGVPLVRKGSRPEIVDRFKSQKKSLWYTKDFMRYFNQKSQLKAVFLIKNTSEEKREKKLRSLRKTSHQITIAFVLAILTSEEFLPRPSTEKMSERRLCSLAMRNNSLSSPCNHWAPNSSQSPSKNVDLTLPPAWFWAAKQPVKYCMFYAVRTPNVQRLELITSFYKHFTPARCL